MRCAPRALVLGRLAAQAAERANHLLALGADTLSSRLHRSSSHYCRVDIENRLCLGLRNEIAGHA